MRTRNPSFLILRIISLIFIVAAVVVTMFQLVNYSRERNNYPAGMTIGGVSVGGVNAQIASERVLQVYSQPVEIQYAGEIIHIYPTVIGFSVDIESMLAAADLARTTSSFWGGFWDSLWNRPRPASAIPLRASLIDEQLLAYLETEVAARYDQPATAAQPIAGSVNFEVGQPGQELNIGRALTLIEDALRSPTNRVVTLSYEQTAPTRPTIKNLEILLKQIINLSGFDGVIGLYLANMQNAQEIHFGLDNGAELSVTPDIPFTASSTIKIPIMISNIIHHGTPNEKTDGFMKDVFQQSDNAAADILMTQIDAFQGPLIVTEDMQALGLENTFMAGFFCNPANPCPLLRRYSTPANQRTDVFTNPDDYNQTTISDIGMLLTDIYQCAESGGGALLAAFPGQLTQADCQLMIDYMEQDKFGSLIQAGLPDGTKIAHKHGFVPDRFGVVHDISDAGIIYTPGGNFVLAIYTYHPVQGIWGEVNPLFVELTQAVYNYFNLSSP
ncbi:MAG: serine hydrolase [Anaerolineae bacterium]|nr:serine hydrolase [Anaerolineae bacterium]